MTKQQQMTNQAADDTGDTGDTDDASSRRQGDTGQ